MASKALSLNPAASEVMVPYQAQSEEASAIDMPLNSPLYSHYKKHVIEALPIQESDCHFATRRTLQTVSIIMGVGFRIPFITSSLIYAGSNHASYGWTLAMAGVLGWGAFCTYCLLNITTGELRPLSEEEKEAHQSKTTCLKTSCLAIEKIILAAIGVASQFPLAYMCYVNNDNNLTYPILVMIDSGIPIYSLFLSSDAAKARCATVKESDRVLIQAKKKLINAIRHFRTELPKSYQTKDSLLQSLFESSKNNPIEFLRLILEDLPSEEPASQERIPCTTQLVGTVLTISQLAIYALLTYNGMKLFTDDEPAQYSVTVIVTLINAYLQGTGITNSLHRQLTNFTSAFNRATRHTVAVTCFPIFRRVLSVIDLAAAGLNYSFCAQVSDQFMTGKLAPYATTQTILSSIGTFFLLTNALQDVFDDFVIYIARNTRFGNQKMKDLIQLDRRLLSFTEVINDCPLPAFQSFLKSLPEDLSQQLLDEAEPN